MDEVTRIAEFWDRFGRERDLSLPPLENGVGSIQRGSAIVTVTYFSRDPETGDMVDFACDAGECSTGCVPDAVTVSVTNYEFRRFFGALGLPPVTLPDFKTSMAMGSAGCDETGNCLP